MVSRSRLASPLVTLLGAIFFFSSQVFAISAVLGVDLGTEYIKAALVKPGVPLDIVLTKDSRRKEISAVAFKPTRGGAPDGEYPERIYGSDAMALSARFPGEVYPNLKPLLGLPIDDSIVQEYAARHPVLALRSHPTRGTASFKTGTLPDDQEAWLVEELLAMQLQSVQKNAELAAGDSSTVRNIVLTVPPFYTTEEKRAVQSAAELAGLKVLSLISDGLAVGLNYATSRQFPNVDEGAKPEYHMVFDMGAGSTKASVLRFQGRNVKDIGKFNKTVQDVQVLGSGWDRTLGGDGLNSLIVDDMVEQFVQSKGGQKVSATVPTVRAHGRAMAKLNKEAERLRHVLSANQNTQASFEGLYEDVDFKYKITRAEFETMAAAHADRVAATINDALKMSGLDMGDLDSVILHGGASRTPFVQKALEQIVGSADKLRSNVNSDEAAVFGAGFRAAELSPSFRVKEIRASEGSGYPVGIKYNSGENEKAQTQRVWTPISPMGGPTKEFTLNQEADFTATFYQQFGEEYRDIKSFTTKNLTATLAAVKSAHPSCADLGGYFFRVGAKLNSENGEVEIVKAAVECEAEAKEGLMDGVKNLFGFGKKDQEPLQDGKEASEKETETVVDSEEKAGEDAESSTAADAEADSDDAAAKGETEGSAEEVKAEVKKTELISVPVDFTLENLGTPDLSKAQLTQAKDRLKAFAASDKARLQREEALNQLEAYTYKVRDLLDDEVFIASSSDTERTKLSEKASEISEWLDEHGSDSVKKTLQSKLKELQALTDPITKRKQESEKRPESLGKLKETLTQTFKFVESMRKQIDDYEAFQASSSAASEASGSEKADGEFDGLEDDAAEATKDEDKGPAPPMYKREDLNELDEVSKSAEDWLKDLESKQEKLAANADPVLIVKDLDAKREKIEQIGKDLAVKGAKAFGGKKKPNKEKRKSSKTGSADPAQQTIKIGDKDFSAEDLEEMIKGMNEEDWKQVEEQLAKQKVPEAEEGQETHDEL